MEKGDSCSQLENFRIECLIIIVVVAIAIVVVVVFVVIVVVVEIIPRKMCIPAVDLLGGLRT